VDTFSTLNALKTGSLTTLYALCVIKKLVNYDLAQRLELS